MNEINTLVDKAQKAINHFMYFTGDRYTVEVTKHDRWNRYKMKLYRNSDQEVLSESRYLREKRMKRSLEYLIDVFGVGGM